MKRMGTWCCCLLFMVLLGIPLLGQTPASPAASASSPELPQAVTDKPNALEAKVAAAQSSADNAWMLVSAALVLLMTAPGLALFYCGLVRKKNVLGVMMQCFIMMGLGVPWASS